MLFLFGCEERRDVQSYLLMLVKNAIFSVYFTDERLTLAHGAMCHFCGLVLRSIEFQLVCLWYDRYLPLFSVLHKNTLYMYGLLEGALPYRTFFISLQNFASVCLCFLFSLLRTDRVLKILFAHFHFSCSQSLLLGILASFNLINKFP